ncbi:MAG: PAS domain S-box protein [Acidobacteriota bacterium]
MRKTGIDIIGDAPWGTHFCQFYRTRHDLTSILVPYFKAGLENNEFCMWVTSTPLTERQAKSSLRRAIPGFDDYLKRGQIEILPYSEWYLKGGSFDLDRVLNGWVEKLEEALEKGYEGLRLTGNTAWLEKANWKDFADYEEAINSVIGKHRMMALCTYSLAKCGAAEILDVLRNHQFALIRSEKGWDLIEASSLKEARERVRQSERRYHTLFNAMSEGFALHEIICDPDGIPSDYRFLEVNPAFERLTGLKKEQVVGRTVRQVLPEIEPSWIEAYGKVALSGQPTYLEQRADSLQKDYGVIAFAPAERQFATLFLDITDRKRREDELTKTNLRLDILSETASQLLKTDSPEAVVDALCRKVMGFMDCQVFFNYLVDEGKHQLRLNAYAGIPEDEARRIEWLDYGEAVCGRVALNGRPIICGDIGVKSDPGTELVKSYGIQAYACHPLISQGRVVGTLSFGARNRTQFDADDISLMRTVADQVAIAIDRKRAEEALHKAKNALEQRVEERTRELRTAYESLRAEIAERQRSDRINLQLAAIVESSNDAIIGKTLDGLITSWNKGAERMYGYTAEEIIGKPVSVLVPPDQGDDSSSILERIRRGQRFEQYETVRIRRDGRRITVVLTVSPIKDANGTIVGVSSIARDITERERMAEELRSASLYARSLIEASLDPLVTISQEGKITDVNKATELATGLTRERLIGSNFSDYFTEPDKANEGYRKVISEGFVRDYPLTIRHTSGRTTEVLYNATVYRNEAGETQGVFAAARDVTDRKRMEEELRAVSRYARSLIEASLDPLVTISPEGKITDVNQATELATGLGRDRLIGSNFSDYFTEPDRANIGYQKVISEGQIRDYPLTIRHTSGRTTDVLYNATVYRNEAGEVQGVFAAARDVTELKAAQERRDLTNSLLELFALKNSSQEYLDSAVEVIRTWSNCEAVGIRITDENREIPFASCVGLPSDFLALENRLSLETDRCICIRAVTERTEEQEGPLMTPAGSFRCEDTTDFVESLSEEQKRRYRGNCMEFGYRSLVVIPIRYRDQVLGAVHLADHRPAHFSASAVALLESLAPLIGEAIHRFRAEAELSRYRDHLEELVKQRTSELQAANSQLQTEIAERRRAEESLRETAEELARSNRDLEQFAYVASHDLQEPLRAVAGYVELLQHRYGDKLDDKALQFIAGASDGAARMQTLIVDLLAFSRLGTQGKRFESTDLNKVLDLALSGLKVSLQEAGAKVKADALPVLDVDATQIAQLFQNLIGNAIKFRSDRPPEIHVSVKKRRGFWLFSVQDNGIGIEPQYQERIFLLFQRLHTRMKYPGTGIGLAICKKIVERHGGRIWVDSEPGKGSLFYFTIPVKENLS